MAPAFGMTKEPKAFKQMFRKSHGKAYDDGKAKALEGFKAPKQEKDKKCTYR